jgi:putative ABC transport system permease protein
MSGSARPPKPLARLLERILPGHVGSEGAGDFEEVYTARVNAEGKKSADRWYALQILRSLPPFIKDRLQLGFAVFRASLTITLRDIKKNPVYAFINVFGLALGLASCIVVMLFVRQELSFDRFHQNADRIFRLTDTEKTPTREMSMPWARAITGPTLKEEFPEVMDFARILVHRAFVIEYGDNRITTDPTYADPQFFDMFNFPFVRGTKAEAFRYRDSVVISETLARKIFGIENPQGKIITMHSPDKKYDLQVTGVIKDMPRNSHIRFDLLLPFSHLENQRREENRDLSRMRCPTYLLLASWADAEALEKKFPAFLKKHFGDQFVAGHIYGLQALTSIHLHSNFGFDNISLDTVSENNSKGSLSYYLSIVALMILLVAGANSVNLSTSRAGRRLREVGIRKAVGARRAQLLRQFLGESLSLSFIALAFAVILAALFLSFFNSLVGEALKVDFRGGMGFLGGVLMMAIIVGFLSGVYPAIFLSSLSPVETLKGDTIRGGRSGGFWRSGLVVFQFALSLVLIMGTFITMKQMRYIQNKNLGFNRDNIIQIWILKDSELTKKGDLIRRELEQNPNILQVAMTSDGPGAFNGYPVPCIPQGFPADNPIELYLNFTGPGYFDFFGIPVTRGRGFSANIQNDAESAVILNETAVRALGWADPVGKLISGPELLKFFDRKDPVVVIGVVKDFINAPLHEEIRPCIFQCASTHISSIYIRVRPDRIRETIAFLEKIWKKLPTYLPLEYSLFDPSAGEGYRADRSAVRIFSISSVLTICLAGLGMFGLALFTAERRKKEIGIRKAIGATESEIVGLLSKDYFRPVLMANFIAWPIGYYVVRRWLNGFAFRMDLTIWPFILASAMVFLISLSTISFQAIRAARTNPAEILRHD